MSRLHLFVIGSITWAAGLWACGLPGNDVARSASGVDAGRGAPADPPCDLGPSGGSCYPLPDTCAWGSCQNVIDNAYVCMSEGTASIGQPCSGGCAFGSHCSNGVCAAWCDDEHPCAVGQCVPAPRPCADRPLGLCVVDPPDSGVAPLDPPCDIGPCGSSCHPLPDTCASGSCQNVVGNGYACMPEGTAGAGTSCAGPCAKGHACYNGVCSAWCDDVHPCATGACVEVPSPCSDRTLGLCL